MLISLKIVLLMAQFLREIALFYTKSINSIICEAKSRVIKLRLRRADAPFTYMFDYVYWFLIENVKVDTLGWFIKCNEGT